MADKSNLKKEYLDILEKAWDNAADKEGVNLNKDQINELYKDLDTLDATKVREWLSLNKESLSRIPEVASLPAFVEPYQG